VERPIAGPSSRAVRIASSAHGRAGQGEPESATITEAFDR